MPSRDNLDGHGYTSFNDCCRSLRAGFSLIADVVRTRLPFPADLLKITPLAGDASNRRYYRLNLSSSAPSVILMQLASPEVFKQSEEAVSGAVTTAELPFINILNHLAKAAVAVPTLVSLRSRCRLAFSAGFWRCHVSRGLYECAD